MSEPSNCVHPCYLTHEEADVLAVAMAESLDPESTATNRFEASALIWAHPKATQVQRSLATMLAEL